MKRASDVSEPIKLSPSLPSGGRSKGKRCGIEKSGWLVR